MVGEGEVVAQDKEAGVEDEEAVAKIGSGVEGDEDLKCVGYYLEARCGVRYGDCNPGLGNRLDEFLGWTFDTT